jgi:hypothetical protein
MSQSPPASGDQARTERVLSPISSRPRRAHTRSRVDFDGVNRAALPLLSAILQRILPNGRREGNEYLALNPRRGDRHLGSFRINLANGRWADFALADKSARGGDPISLVAYVCNIKQSEAALGLTRMLGMEAR